MRKVIVGCGVCLIGFMLAFATSTASANQEGSSKRTPPRAKAPKSPAPEGFCLPPGNHCAPAKPQGFCWPPGSPC